MKFIFMTWINLWCGTFKYQDPVEQQFRVNQLIQVLKKFKNGQLFPNKQDINNLLNHVITTTTNYSRHK